MEAVPVQVSALRLSSATSPAAQRRPPETCVSRSVAAVRASPRRPSQPQGSWVMGEAPLRHRVRSCAPSAQRRLLEAAGTRPRWWRWLGGAGCRCVSCDSEWVRVCLRFLLEGEEVVFRSSVDKSHTLGINYSRAVL